MIRALLCTAATAAVFVLASPAPAAAYVGPGAGIAFLSSFLVLFTTIVLAIFSLLLWPFRAALRMIRGVKLPKANIKRFIVVGLDGQDPNLTDRFMKEGKLPNFTKLAEQGCYSRLATTFPSVSPVAWSSFSTGSHPARHNIYDFLDRDRRTYLPVLSSTYIGKVERTLNLGRFRIPVGKPELRLLRKSKPFWSVLGEYNIWSTILRVPITFPPDRFYGAQLSAMCVPDLLGTQGTFMLFTTRASDEKFKEGGIRVAVERNGDRIETAIEGPANELVDGSPPLKIPLAIELDRGAGVANLDLNGDGISLRPGELSDWVDLTFKAAPGFKMRGICRMMVTEMPGNGTGASNDGAGEAADVGGEQPGNPDGHFSLYVTPINLDPEKPAMPISHPSYYAIYLAKKLGKYSTLGLAEDTWALNEGVIDDGTFLNQTYDIDREREQMFFAALDRLRRGALVCVWDGTDRIQHMFWRYLEDGHPAARGVDDPEHGDAIEQLYVHNDALVGRVMEKLKDGDLLMVVSDHGFNSFRRGVNLNRWLLDNGYLALKDGVDGSSEWLGDIDWSKTKAYCLGLTGMFLNVVGREAQGIVEPDEVDALKAEIIDKLNGLVDEECDEVGVNEVFNVNQLYAGPYIGNAPDLLIGYNAGYRTSWDCATGMVSGPVFEDNVKAWSGDHCIDPRIVPGVLFCNRPIVVDDPALIDIAPTALHQFGIEPPAYMDGKSLFRKVSEHGESPQEGGGDEAGDGNVPGNADVPGSAEVPGSADE